MGLASLSAPCAAQLHVAGTQAAGSGEDSARPNLGNRACDALGVTSFLFPHLSNDRVYFRVIFIDSKSQVSLKMLVPMLVTFATN